MNPMELLIESLNDMGIGYQETVRYPQARYDTSFGTLEFPDTNYGQPETITIRYEDGSSEIYDFARMKYIVQNGSDFK